MLFWLKQPSRAPWATTQEHTKNHPEHINIHIPTLLVAVSFTWESSAHIFFRQCKNKFLLVYIPFLVYDLSFNSLFCSQTTRCVFYYFPIPCFSHILFFSFPSSQSFSLSVGQCSFCAVTWIHSNSRTELKLNQPLSLCVCLDMSAD